MFGPRFTRGRAGFRVVATWTFSEAVATVPFVGLVGFDEFIVDTRAIQRAGSSRTTLQASIDNGSNYLTSSGSYENITASGVESALTDMVFHSTDTTAARGGQIWISCNQSGNYKMATRVGDGVRYRIVTNSPINALRLLTTDAGNITAGSAVVYAR